MPTNRSLKLTVFVSLMLAAAAASAQVVPTGYRKILSLGCHRTDTTCFVEIEGAAVGPLGCQATSVRWDTANTPGKNHLALFMSAQARGKRVSLAISPACYANQPNFPTFDYSYVE
jgi:hypothetical protein